MATKREQFQALRKTGMDATTAQNQVYGAIPTSIIAPVAPTISASVTPQVANIGGEMPKAPEIAPVTPVTAPKIAEIQSNVPPQRDITKESIFTPPPTVEAPKIETLGDKNRRQNTEFAQKSPAQEFMTDIERRNTFGQVEQEKSKDQMLSNVGIMAKEDPATLSDRAKFNAKTGYDTKPEAEKVILDQYFGANTPKTSDDIKKQLASGVTISDPKVTNTPAFRQAKFENDRMSRYSGMSSEQLFTEMKSGLPSNIANSLKGTPAYNEAMTKFDQYKKVDNINRASEFLATGKSREVDPLTQLSQQLTAIFNQPTDTGSTAEAYKSFLSQNPEITEPTKEYNIKMGQRKELERARESLVEDLKKKYAGEPLSTILAIASRDAKPMNDQINTLNDSLATLGADIKYKTDLATQEFGFYQQDQQAKTAKQSKLQDLLGGLAVSQFGKQQDQAFDMQKMEVQQKYQADRDTQNYLQDLQKMGVANVYDLQKMGQSQDFQKELVALNQKYENSRSVRDFQNDISKMGFQFDMQRKGKVLDLANEKEMESYKASLNPDIAEKWQAVRDRATENTSLADLWGTNVGTYKGNRGYDLAGKMGDPIVAPPGAKVVEVRTQDGSQYFLENGQAQEAKGKDVGYGNSVLLQLPDGKYMRLSHLQDINVNLGDDLGGGAVVGTRGNTGKVLGKGGEQLTPEQLASGRGAHVDVEIGSKLLANGQIDTGSLLSNADQKAYLGTIKPFGKSQTTGYSDADIATFNSEKYNPQTDKDTKRVDRYNQYTNDRAVLQSDPNTSTLDLMRLSRGQKNLGQAENKAYKDINTVVSQLESLNKSITEYNKEGFFGGNELGPISGLIASKNPWDTKGQQIQAQLQALVPKVARGVFGEVGVLTDADIANYMKTLPTIKQTANVQDVVQFALLDTLKNSLDSAVAIDSGTYDIAGLSGSYKKLDSKITELRKKIEDTSKNGNTSFYQNY